MLENNMVRKLETSMSEMNPYESPTAMSKKDNEESNFDTFQKSSFGVGMVSGIISGLELVVRTIENNYNIFKNYSVEAERFGHTLNIISLLSFGSLIIYMTHIKK